MNVDNALCALSDASNEIDDFMTYLNECYDKGEKPTETQVDCYLNKIGGYIDTAEEYLEEDDYDD